VIDGVDIPLADLFLSTTSGFSPTAEGVARARSATEAFLYRRLQTRSQAAGRFKLNERLPIPFDGAGKLEVDLLDAQARLAIELDGPHHLSDAEAYRRDRRKDFLLQQYGYFVLRFLAEDVGKRLDSVLDTVTHVLTTRKRE
jgi:very-short-patch-repair endonuclease